MLPTWNVNPLPTEKLYINSVDISSDGSRVLAGNYYFNYSKTANHTVDNPSFEVGVFLYDSVGKLQWQDTFSADEGVYWVAQSKDGSHSAAGGKITSGEGFIYSYISATGTKSLHCQTKARVNRVALDSTGSALVAGADGTYFFTRSGATWSAPQVIPCATGDSIVSVDISDAGDWVVSGSKLGVLSLLKKSGGKLTAVASWQQPSGSIYWVAMAASGDAFAAGAKNGEVVYVKVAGFSANPKPTWTYKLPSVSRCGCVAITADGTIVSAVGNVAKAGKVVLLDATGSAANPVWEAATLHNPNSTSIDASGNYITVADGQPDGTPGAFYLLNKDGSLNWRVDTGNMSWPMKIAAGSTGIAAGSDDSNVYYFS